MDRDYLAEMHPEIVILEPPELDVAIVGLLERDGEEVLVYSRRKLIECFEKQGMDNDGANEWFDFNVAQAYMGPRTPLYLTTEWGD